MNPFPCDIPSFWSRVWDLAAEEPGCQDARAAIGQWEPKFQEAVQALTREQRSSVLHYLTARSALAAKHAELAYKMGLEDGCHSTNG